jgi:hypothetical protein
MGVAIALFPVMSGVAAQPGDGRPTRLDCLIGYPDGTFRGDRALTRFEFAAGMAACLDRQVQSVEAQKGGFATRQEVNTLLQTQQDLNREIQQLNERVRLLSE